MASGRGDTDLLLLEVSQRLTADGIRCAGTVQINTIRAAGSCDMDVRVLPDGPTLRISQNLGSASRGCRLDPSSLEAAVGQVATVLEFGADLLIVNKFGKHEADGRGFRDVIAQAIGRDIPVLVGVNALNLEAFKAFAGPEASPLAPSAETICQWVKSDPTCRSAVA
ncbi:hypothetical protein KIN_03410 [Litoreibacter roseus]|uniref:Nucleoside-triphosphatase THEP1 n=2 Tax=Litoreibacter roseus TaxID=2601869 RepID=A0A6N6JB94_9RHOB|nr:hypothetical protein KIN_03410 [Litoreibacter roseus]